MTTPHNESDKKLTNAQITLSAAYNKAYKDIKAEIAQLLADADLTADNGAQRLAEVQKYDRLQRLSKKLAKILATVNNVAAKDIDKLGRNIYQLNYNAAADEFGYKDIDKTKSEASLESTDAYNLLALAALTDKRAIERTIKSSLITGVLQSKGNKGIFSAIKQDIAKQLESGIKIATTVTTQSENKAIFDVGEKATANGKIITKVWRAVGDSKTRPAHSRASGQVVELGKPFLVGGEKLMYPGDWSLGASPGNTINCRCVIALIEKE